MLFNSPEFLFCFLPIFLVLYFTGPRRGRNLILFAASLIFYFATSGQLTVVLILSVVVNYVISIQMDSKDGSAKKAWFVSGILINLAPLVYYKYSRFTISAVNDAFSTLAFRIHLPSPDPILPIGISFFTFQAISYISDVYMTRVKPSRNLVDFGMYHSCFPQLIAGPIVRYEEIAPQICHRQTRLDDIYEGMVRFCFGLGKKVIIADNTGQLANWAFSLPESSLDCVSAWCGIISYTLQIYFDFSGYSDMAIGLGRMLGFPYPENFDQPYRSCSITEFWRRWHMTLSRWFRDYIYIALGGNRKSSIRTLLNLGIVFFLCGLWHGAGYTFVSWGLYHGILLIIERVAKRSFMLKVPAIIGWTYTIIAVMVGWVLFRAENIGSAIAYLKSMFGFRSFAFSDELVSIFTADKQAYLYAGILISLLPLSRVAGFSRYGNTVALAAGVIALGVAMLAIVMMSVNGFSPFIYFKF